MTEQPEVVLVSMPYHCVERPNMALGILAATLRGAGIATRCLHANLDFAARIGLDAYEVILGRFSGQQFAELTFTEAAFRGDAPRYQAYLGSIIDAQAVADGSARIQIPRLFHAVRGTTTAFIDEVARAIVDKGPRIVGCSSMFEQHVASLALLRRIKELDPGIVTMIGGPNAEGEMGRATVNNFRWVDYAVSGEADALIVPLCRRILDGPATISRRELPSGVLRREPLASTGGDAHRVVLEDMDAVCTPDFDDYFQDLDDAPFRDRVLVGLTVETSRGCWYGQKRHCTFCGQNGMGMKFRSKSPQRVLDEFRGLAARYGIPNFGVVDNILDLAYFDRVLPELERDATDYRIFYELKPNMKRPQLEQLWRAGIRSVIPGFESLDDEPLALMRKGTSMAINVQVLKWARELGIYVHWIMLHGVPGESDDAYGRMEALIPKLMHLQPPNIATPIEFHRFSPYLDDPEAWGLELEPHPAYAALYPLPPDQLREIAYYFVDRSAGAWNSVSPARRRCLLLLNDWIAAYVGGAALVVEPRGDGGAIVRDTRPCAERSELELTPRQHALHRCLDSVASRRAAGQQMAALGYDEPDAIDRDLDVLEARHLVVRTGPKLLALGTAEPRPPQWLDYKAPHGVVLPPNAAQTREPAHEPRSEHRC